MLAYILSQPRSGSTVLSAMLDRRKGVVCMPESSFPQVLSELPARERKNPRWLAAIYRASTFPPRPKPPTPLFIRDIENCMEGTDEEILFSLGQEMAAKLGRKREEVCTVVWKTTRTIAMNRGPLNTKGKFIVLRRHPWNVFESQFRVDFGVRNRRPWRYAIFTQSYEWAFSQIPPKKRLDIEYEKIPESMDELVGYLDLKDKEEWDSAQSSLAMAAESVPWLQEATAAFESKDAEKRKRIDPETGRNLDRWLALTRFFRPLMGPLRNYFDAKTFGQIRVGARYQLGLENLDCVL